jgi:hypothetical protein
LFCHDRINRCRNIAGDACDSHDVPADSAAHQRILTMNRMPGAAGFDGRPASVASTRLHDAVAATLAIGSLSLCLVVTLTVFSIKVSMAMPIPA